MLSVQKRLTLGIPTLEPRHHVRTLMLIERMGFVFSGHILCLLFAPLVADIVYNRLGYYVVFGIIFRVFGFDLLLRAFMVEKRKPSQTRRLLLQLRPLCEKEDDTGFELDGEG